VRVAYVSTYDSSDATAWSGLGLGIRRALEDAGADVFPIGPLSHRYGTYFRLRGALHDLRASTRYEADREPLLLRHYAKEIGVALERMGCDLIFSPGTIPIACLPPGKPVAFWTDATFDAMLGFYPSFSRLSKRTISNGHRAEQSALDRCSLALYSSRWAAESATRYYGVSAEKVRAVPFGANVDGHASEAAATAAISGRRIDPVQLLFVGTDWERKRGAIAVEVATRLNERGIPAVLDVVGVQPPRKFPHVREHGFLSRGTAEGRSAMEALYSAATFLILPSIAECCAVVLSEASAYGVPSLATETGGNATAVRNGVNGQLFAVRDTADAYCAFVERTVASRDAYDRLALGSYREYAARLNWTASGREVVALLDEIVSG
jgi:glycosyltransferase involved in cell wall biosynthesis